MDCNTSFPVAFAGNSHQTYHLLKDYGEFIPTWIVSTEQQTADPANGKNHFRIRRIWFYHHPAQNHSILRLYISTCMKFALRDLGDEIPSALLIPF